MKILYIGPVRDFSGYATAARGYINALHKAGADLVVRPVRYDQADPGSEYQPTSLELSLMRRNLSDIDVVIQHVTPNEMRPVDGKVNIAVTAWETTRIPQYWVDKLNKFNAVITFCESSVQAFRDSGVTVSIYKVPHTFDMGTYNLDGVEPIQSASAPEVLKDRFIFYNISQFSTKKGLDLLLRAYLGEFHGEKDDVILVLKTYINMTGRADERDKILAYIHATKQGMRLPNDGYPPIMVITKTLSDEMIKRLHATSDCYVCSSRGEGWCIPAFEALAYGNKLVTTTWGGMGEFAELHPPIQLVGDTIESCRTLRHHANVYPVYYSLEPLIGQNHADPELYTAADKIAEASVSSLMRQMRTAFRSRKEKAPDLTQFDYANVGPKMLDIIEQVANQEVSNVG